MVNPKHGKYKENYTREYRSQIPEDQKSKEKVLKAERGKHVTSQETMQMIVHYSSEIVGAKRQWNDISKWLKNIQPEFCIQQNDEDEGIFR